MADQPIQMILFCPLCSTRHIDRGESQTKPHHTHACQKCGFVWRPAVAFTVGVEFLTGFKDVDPLDLGFMLDEAPLEAVVLERDQPELLTVEEYTLARHWRDQCRSGPDVALIPRHELRMIAESVLRLDPERKVRGT